MLVGKGVSSAPNRIKVKEVENKEEKSEGIL
jgi:hypothetical protein